MAKKHKEIEKKIREINREYKEQEVFDEEKENRKWRRKHLEVFLDCE